MKEKVNYHEVFRAVEKAVKMNAPQLYCSDCHKGFFKVKFVDVSEPDYIIEIGGTYSCKDHLLYDLFVNPEITEDFVISVTKYNGTRKVQVHVRMVEAHIFIPFRLN